MLRFLLVDNVAYSAYFQLHYLNYLSQVTHRNVKEI